MGLRGTSLEITGASDCSPEGGASGLTGRVTVPSGCSTI